MTERERRMMDEVERLQRHVDAAFAHACAGDAHAARVELTEARWGAWGSESARDRARRENAHLRSVVADALADLRRIAGR